MEWDVENDKMDMWMWISNRDIYVFNLTHLTRGRSKSHARVYIAAGFGISVVQYKPAEASRE